MCNDKQLKTKSDPLQAAIHNDMITAFQIGSGLTSNFKTIVFPGSLSMPWPIIGSTAALSIAQMCSLKEQWKNATLNVFFAHFERGQKLKA